MFEPELNRQVEGHEKTDMRLTIRAAIAFLLLAGSITWISAEGSFVIVAQLINAASSEKAVRIEKNKAYGQAPRQRLDIYEPAQNLNRGPIIIFYYGGGWTSGDRSFYAFVGSALASQGITTVIPDYRLFPDVQFPTFVEDAALAYSWVVSNVAQGSGENRPVIVMGHSAGAHIAALLALDTGYIDRAKQNLPRPAALISLAGPLAFDPTTWPSTSKIFAQARSQPDTTRPFKLVRAGDPPALLLHGLADQTVQLKNARQTADAMRAAGNDVTEIEYGSVGHVGIVLAIARPARWRAPVLDDILKFIFCRFKSSDLCTEARPKALDASGLGSPNIEK